MSASGERTSMKSNEHSRRLVITLAYLAAVATFFAFTHMARAADGATEFWLAPPDVTDLNNVSGGEPIYLVVISAGAPSTVTIDQPANGSFTPIVINVMANTSGRVNLTPFKPSLETRP